MDYYQKYQKYKFKYYNLLNQSGGRNCNNCNFIILDIKIYDVNNLLNVKVTPNLVNFLATGSYTNNTVSQFLLLSKQPDETNINMSFDKEDGQTSYGFIVPSNLSPSVLNNIDVITRQVQQKLLNTQQGITINTV
jgi:hypothetical protein